MTIQNQQGRTMLEMLGVLAIMGIITYGAIAGINYGMSSYKINQTYNEVQDIIHGVEDLYSWSKEYPNSNDMMEAACNNGIFAKECDEHNEVSGAFGNIIIRPIDDNKNFQVEVSITDGDERTRVNEMDWASVNIKAECTDNGSKCVFYPK